MLPLSLGMAWLLLAPLCLWLLIRGSTKERAGALVTLALLEMGTIGMDALPHPAVPVRSAAARAVPMPSSCDERAQVPHTAGIEDGGLLLSWPATSRECACAEVTLLARDRKLLIWLHTRREAQPGSPALPVRVEDGTASLRVPLPGKARHAPADGRSGRLIPQQAA
ncbi:hypothetical protein [Nonomuraea gerenzanensis]|uniref:Uncharacterized protein n=1 Tax=Nonomuraea gerenzanensis TaxID=93944 RepID=A0A1M4E276_9ACTN|nr:hypothetical protein [Nonomuraea gerenzanensis]UBU15196.1 hypothetical protein LCN96_09260 [Nonomuraea gerenzanensis]SBO92937.1 hypothetical protein BN4615_P2451 [Nonomuraea gerenzanensis]